MWCRVCEDVGGRGEEKEEGERGGWGRGGGGGGGERRLGGGEHRKESEGRDDMDGENVEGNCLIHVRHRLLTTKIVESISQHLHTHLQRATSYFAITLQNSGLDFVCTLIGEGFMSYNALRSN